MVFPDSSAGKESACNAGDLGSIPGLGRYPAERKGSLLQYSGLENSMNCIVDTTEGLSLLIFHYILHFNEQERRPNDIKIRSET